jgi:cobalt-zinc-cadmium resistance protein CzcA
MIAPVLLTGYSTPSARTCSREGFFISVVLFFFIGREFIPRLDEGDILLQPVRLPSISLSESLKTATRIERVVKQFPEVKTVVTRPGTAEIATDVMGIESA